MPRTGRPPKAPKDRREDGIKLPLTEAEKALIVEAAEIDGTKPITWARETVLGVAMRRISRAEKRKSKRD
jgi:hypothetical protein